MTTATVEGVEVDTRHWIGGERVASQTTFTDISPIDEQSIAEISAGSVAEVDAAVRAAEQAFPGWAAMPRHERAELLRKVADGIDARAEELARVETRDNGSLLRSHRRSVMPRVGMNFRFFADYLEKLGHPGGEIRGHRERVTYDPAGVTAIITPWNAPLMLATWRIGPALAAGNTVVAKPPEWAPLTASLLADITQEAGVPAGVFNVVQGTGAHAGAPLTAHPGIRRLSFTGSVPTAGVIAKAAAPNIVPLSFELGGKSPLVVFADSEFDLAVSLAVEQFDNSGQVCLGAFRILVEDSIADRFTEAVLAKAQTIMQGDPRDEQTDMSCLVSRQHFDRVDGFVRRALAAGARPILGGSPNERAWSPLLSADDLGRRGTGERDLDRGGFRPSPHRPDFLRRGAGDRPCQRHAVRPCRDLDHRGSGSRRAGQRPAQRRNGLGQLLLRPRPRRTVWRKWQIRDRSRGRDLFVRLLHRHQEHRVLAQRLDHERVTPALTTARGHIAKGR